MFNAFIYALLEIKIYETLALLKYLDFIHLWFALLISSLLSCLFLTVRTFPKEYVVYKGIFQQGEKYKHKASH